MSEGQRGRGYSFSLNNSPAFHYIWPYPMQQLIKKTEELTNKAKKLVNENQKLHQSVQNLENELQSLRQQLEEEAQKNAELNNKIKIIKLARNIGSGEGGEGGQVAELKRKINEYIKELDNCIAMLNE